MELLKNSETKSDVLLYVFCGGYYKKKWKIS